MKLLDILKEQGYWSDGADKVASEKQKCGISGQQGNNSREMRQQDRELAASNRAEAKANAAELKKTLDMRYNRDNEPLDKSTRNQIFGEYKQFNQGLLDGGSYSPEQKFAVLYKVYDWVKNVPSISYTKNYQLNLTIQI